MGIYIPDEEDIKKTNRFKLPGEEWIQIAIMTITAALVIFLVVGSIIID